MTFNRYLATSAMFMFVLPLFAQKGTADIRLVPRTNELANSSFMATFIKDGKVIKQDEMRPNVSGSAVGTAMSYGLLPGVYDIRVEGEGAITVVKKGIAITPDFSTSLYFELKPGSGLKVIEYEHSELTRDELTIRLKKLEEQLNNLMLQFKK